MNKYTIHTPIWSGENRIPSIGISEHRLPCMVYISYKDKHDNLVYPNTYIISRDFASKYPEKDIGHNIILRIIPISDLIIIEDKENIGSKTN